MELVVNGKVPSVASLMRTLNISRSAAQDVRNQLAPPQNFPGDHSDVATHPGDVTGDQNPASESIEDARPTREPTPKRATRRPRIVASTDPRDIADATLNVVANVVSDLEETRKSTANRYQYMTTKKVALTTAKDENGRAIRNDDGTLKKVPATYPNGAPKSWGLGLDPAAETDDNPILEAAADKSTVVTPVDFVKKMLTKLENDEAEAIAQLENQVARNPLGPFIKNQTGLGLKQTGRLIAQIGDPYWNALHQRPRKLSELWEFCGHGGPSQKKKDHQVTWSPEAKMRLWNISNSILKTKGEYRSVYDDRRTETEGRVHSGPCKRCAPAGKSETATGKPWSKGHQHADALRIVGKRVLRDLWIEARRIHGVTDE